MCGAAVWSRQRTQRGADNVTVLLARLIIKENVRPEAPNKAPVHSTPHGVEHASTSIRAAEASGPQPAQAASDPPPAAANTTLAAPASEPAKLSIWKWEIRWPWGHKTASPTALPTPKPGPAEALSLAQNAGQEEHTRKAWECDFYGVVGPSCAEGCRRQPCRIHWSSRQNFGRKSCTSHKRSA